MDFNKTTSAENQYAYNLNNIYSAGNESGDRTGTGTKRIQSTVIHSDLQKEFPILTGKKIDFKNAYTELIWMLTGRNNIQWLRDHGVNYWNEWENEEGTIGKGYGTQFRNFNGVDQLINVVEELQRNPDSRRTLISLWNPSDLNKTTLPPCHFLYHFTSYVSDKDGRRYLDLHVTQRSADYFLGVPYNLVMSGIFVSLMSYYLRMEVGSIHQTFHDSHIYSNHYDQVERYLENVYTDELKMFKTKEHEFVTIENGNRVLTESFKSVEPIVVPKITDNGFFNNTWNNFDQFLTTIVDCMDNNIETLSIENYKHYPFIKAKVSK